MREVDIADPSDGEIIGRGSYATVRRITINEQLYAAKQMHSVLLSNTAGTRLPLLKRALKECLLLSNLQHPNIVQFVGLHHHQGSVTLVMECLSLLLADCLEMCPNLPIAFKYRILQDVSQGLFYLHTCSPAIIHRDLNVNNIMLTQDFTAKIIDFESSVTECDLAKDGTATPCPGAAFAMPPEATVQHPVYDEKLDIYSFGVLTLHVVTQELPTHPDLSFGLPGGQETPVSHHLMVSDHPLLTLSTRCLQSDPLQRPSTHEIVSEIEEAACRDLSTNPQMLIRGHIRKQLQVK